MKRWYFGLGLALGFASSSALSFQEQGGVAPVTPAPAEAQQAAPSDSTGKGLDFSAPKTDGGESEGTEVRIPGLGKLGVLPKMDFGLELLYGANDSKQIEPEQSPPEDLTIRGSVKHNF